MAKRLRCFTLLELLIVMTILAVVAALVVPAGAMAWETAYMAECQSNMRQLCMAMFRFAAKHDGRLPGGKDDPPSLEWLGDSEEAEEEGLWLCPQNGALYTYVRSEKLYVCPKDRRYSQEEAEAWGKKPLFEPGLGNGRFSYTMPKILAGASLRLLLRSYSHYKDIAGDRQRMMVPMLIEEDPEHWLGTKDWDGSWRKSDAFSDRHFDGCTIGFVDGHVENRKMPPLMNADDLKLQTMMGERSFGKDEDWRWEKGIDHWYNNKTTKTHISSDVDDWWLKNDGSAISP